MSISDLPNELLQLIIDIAVHQIGLQDAVKLREICRRFSALVLNSILRLPKTVLLQRRLGESLTLKLIRFKMLLGDANNLLLCYNINCTADYLAGSTTSELRIRYVRVLELSAARTMMYWRLLDCLTTETRRHVRDKELRENALLAAVGASETCKVQELLAKGVNPASSSPFFGEPLAAAASSGSLAMIQLLLDHWDWETFKPLVALRLMNALEVAVDHEDVLVELLNYKDRIDQLTYDEAIIRMIKKNQVASINRLLGLRQEHSNPAAEKDFWLRYVQMATAYNRRALLQRVLERGSPTPIEEASLVVTMKYACMENHSETFQTILSHVSDSDPMCHADSLFWAAWFGNMKILESLLILVQNDQRAILLALAGAVSGKTPEVISHLLKVAGISTIDGSAPTRFTDMISLMFPDSFIIPARSIELPSLQALRGQLLAASKAGKLTDAIEFYHLIKTHYSDHRIGIPDGISQAAENNNLDILLFLCESCDSWLVTSWSVTSYVRSPAVAQLFIDFGWDISQPEQARDSLWRCPPLADFVDDEQFSRWLLSKGAPTDVKGEWDITPTSVAVSIAPISMIKLFLERSTSIRYGQLLHFAIIRESGVRLEAIELLLHLGYPIDSIFFQDSSRSWLGYGRTGAGTALFFAAERGYHEVVAYLLSRGADATKLSSEGYSALEVAESGGYSRVVRLLSP